MLGSGDGVGWHWNDGSVGVQPHVSGGLHASELGSARRGMLDEAIRRIDLGIGT
jgi:hypothetical protein